MVSLESGTIAKFTALKMETVTFVFLVFLGCADFSGGSSIKGEKFGKSLFFNEVMDVTDFSVYYDMKTNQTVTKMMPRPWYRPGWMLRLPFTGGPCKCEALQCRCCTGIRIQSINFDRQTCAILTFDPEEYMIDMDVQMNNASVYKNSFSARNPPPFCIPIPVPYLPPGLVDLCIRLFDITIMGQALHVCMDMDTRIDKAPVLILHFDCMDMGLNGISLSKPDAKPNQSSSDTVTTSEPEQLDSDVYDPVTESVSTAETPSVNFIKYI